MTASKRINLAKFVSLFFGIPWLFAVIIVLLYKADLTRAQVLLLGGIFLIFNIVIPFLSLYYLYKSGRISDYDVTKRDERFAPLSITMFSFLISLILTGLVGNALIFEFSAIIFVILLVNLLITFSWKISLHMGINVASSMLINALYGWKFSFLYLSIPLIYWSRYTLHRHSPKQLIGGLVISGGITVVGLRYFGYI